MYIDYSVLKFSLFSKHITQSDINLHQYPSINGNTQEEFCTDLYIISIFSVKSHINLRFNLD